MVAKCIESGLRHTDVLARYGRDEFVVLLPETAAHLAIAVAQRILHAVTAAPLEFEGQRIATSGSIGLACYPKDSRSIDAIQARAEPRDVPRQGKGRQSGGEIHRLTIRRPTNRTLANKLIKSNIYINPRGFHATASCTAVATISIR